jgi:hypothetical protein
LPPSTIPAFFAQVRVGERGRSAEWPGELDFCADLRFTPAGKISSQAAKAAQIEFFNGIQESE